MIDIIITVYNFDPIRFAMWDAFQSIGIDGTLIVLIKWLGFTIFEDFSIIAGR